MAFIDTYQLIFQNKELQTVTINISDTLSGVGTPVFIPLTAVTAELHTVNDNEDKFSIIRGKRIEFSFKSTTTEALSTFIGATDDQFLVEVYVDTTQIFSGYLITDSTRESFLPPTTYTVQLTASDNLGLLKETPLTKPDGTNPRGHFRIIEYISWCLQKTGLQLPIKAVYNLLPQELSSAGDHAFHNCYLQAKTFEADFNESEDCYTVLEKILKGCTLTQHNNAWWILRVDELNGSSYRIQSFDYLGAIGALATTSTLSKNIGITESIKFIDKDAEVTPERPVKFVQTNLNLELPREIIDNQDFNRGTTWVSPYVVDMSLYIRSYAATGDFPTTGEFDVVYKATGSGLFYKWTGAGYLNITGAEAPVGMAYNLEDWTLVNSAGGSPTINAYVIKIRQFGDEKARYVEMTPGGGIHYLKSSRVPVGRLDKFTMSLDRRFYTNLTGSGLTTENIAQVRLYGDNGTYWTVTNIAFGSDQPGAWVQCTASFTTNQRYLTLRTVRNDHDETKWMSVSVDANPLPVGGELEIIIHQHSSAGTHFANLQFQYYPYINDSYQNYTKQQHTVSHDINTKNKREEEVYTGDLPRPMFKGAIFLKTAGGQYYLTTAWYNFIAGTAGELLISKFGKYQAFEFWNQHNRIIRKFQGSLKGLDTATPDDLPGLIHQYQLTASTDHTDNKTFMLLSYVQNLDSCKWSGVFAEVYDSVDGKLYTSDNEFKYVMQ